MVVKAMVRTVAGAAKEGVCAEAPRVVAVTAAEAMVAAAAEEEERETAVVE